MDLNTICDYLIFFGFLVGSTLFPLWGSLIRKKKQNDQSDTKANYVFATGQVGIFAMMLSIARGTLGVRAFLGYPSELFYRGVGMWETIYGLASAYPIVCFVFVPIYLNLGITSVYQYLDYRFKSKLVRRLASGTFIARNVFIMGITMYTPCVALNTVAGIPYWASYLLMTALGILFTIFGNLKSAITADVIQGITMIIVSFGVIAQGAYDAGGVKKAVTINREHGRLDFFTFSGDITTRIDTLSAWLGQLFISLSVLGCQQNNVQRYMSMKSQKDVTRTLMANVPFVTFLFSLSWLVGMGIYATYFNCDPYKAGLIEKTDEILPFFILERLTYIPGFLGLFMATLFNGSLCIYVSTLNSVATVTWEDFISHMPVFRKFADFKQLCAIKALGVTYAIICMGLAYVVSMFSGVIEISMFVNAATSGTLIGVFILAMLIPFANGKGASVGMIASHTTIIALSIASYLGDNMMKTEFLPTSIEGCNKTANHTSLFAGDMSEYERMSRLNLTFYEAPLAEDIVVERSFVESFLKMSYMYYSVFGSIVTVVVGCIVSLFTTSHLYDSTLVHPVVSRFVKPKTELPVINEKQPHRIINSISAPEKLCEKL
ncbi:sodium-coupled monocarboxylate transporter 1 [Contarinia nasturtii]|uniref:sodium-coupled monocarboxylate transporter 1 n=1 Tax=Contarinia nasturtii TaxID=265458 RepID=UPI0012D3926C|nr:sodium-coupled monocarboxylate transporter 1 [Contarinia nasturtii]